MPELLLKVKSKKRVFNDSKQGVVYEIKAEVISGKKNQPGYEKTVLTLQSGNSTLYNKIPDKSHLKVTWSPTMESLEAFQQ